MELRSLIWTWASSPVIYLIISVPIFAIGTPNEVVSGNPCKTLLTDLRETTSDLTPSPSSEFKVQSASIRDSIRLQLSRDVAFESINIPQGLVVETIDWMIDELAKIQERGLQFVQTEISADSNYRPFKSIMYGETEPIELVHVRELKNKLLKMKKLNEVNYALFVRYAYHFSIAAALKEDAGPKKMKYIAMIYNYFRADKLEFRDPPISFGSRLTLLSAMMLDTEITWLPTHRSIGISEMNGNIAKQIWVLGLTTDPEKVDGIDFYPFGFLQHDLNHLYAALERKKTIQSGEFKGFLTEGDEGEIFHDKFEKWLADEITDKKEQLILQILWHEIFHEIALPENARNLILYLKFDDEIVRLFKNEQKAFRNVGLPSDSEMASGVKKIKEFASNYLNEAAK